LFYSILSDGRVLYEHLMAQFTGQKQYTSSFGFASIRSAPFTDVQKCYAITCLAEVANGGHGKCSVLLKVINSTEQSALNGRNGQNLQIFGSASKPTILSVS
jgi:hypothetical protein